MARGAPEELSTSAADAAADGEDLGGFFEVGGKQQNAPVVEVVRKEDDEIEGRRVRPVQVLKHGSTGVSAARWVSSASVSSNTRSCEPAVCPSRRSSPSGRRASTNGWYGSSVPTRPMECPRRTSNPVPRARVASSAASRVLPIPASPSTRTAPPRPARVASRAPSSSRSSRARPTMSPRASIRPYRARRPAGEGPDQHSAAAKMGWSYGAFVIGDYIRAYGQDRIAGIDFVGGVVKLGQAAFGPADRPRASSITSQDLTADDLPTNIPGDARLPRGGSWPSRLPPTSSRPRCAGTSSCRRGSVPIWRPARSTSTTCSARSRCRCLVTHGRADAAALPAMAEHVLATSPTAEASWYDGVGHAPHVEGRERFNRELAELTRRVLA